MADGDNVIEGKHFSFSLTYLKASFQNSGLIDLSACFFTQNKQTVFLHKTKIFNYNKVTSYTSKVTKTDNEWEEYTLLVALLEGAGKKVH